MQKIFTPVFILLFSVCAHVSLAAKHTAKPDPTVVGSTTLFVLDGQKEYNDALQYIVPKVWTVTPYKFITPNEIKDYLGKSDFSLVLRSKFNVKDKNYDFLRIARGLKKLDDFNHAEFSDGVPVMMNSNGSEENTIPYLPNIVEQLQVYCIVKFKDRQLYYFKAKDWKIRNDRMKGKKLYVLKDVVNYSDELKEKAEKIYPYEIDFVDFKTIVKAIYAMDSTVCYITSGPEQVIDARTGDVLFISSVSPDRKRLLELDFFKDLARRLKKD